MLNHKIKLYIFTIVHLKPIQVYYRVFYALKGKLINKTYSSDLKRLVGPLRWLNVINKPDSYLGNLTFVFLNISYKFEKSIDWNFNKFGKLWVYNLNYFDFLNQSFIKKSHALALIKNYIDSTNELKDGFEPYPISLRCINWIKYLSKENIQDESINKSLYNQYLKLLDNLEYHILGNHLLENGFSLLFGAYYFKDEILYSKARQIIKKELNEQVLRDGAHFELSPMYHQIILDRLLDCIYIIEQNFWHQDQNFLSFLKNKSKEMLSWLDKVTFSNDAIPMVNDSAHNIAPKTSQILEYASKLNIFPNNIRLLDSGYRTFYNKNYELFLDIGSVGPSYQPGHAHADTFNFILQINNRPIIVDKGVSTYNIGHVREEERSTKYHNTVTFKDENSSQVWSGFRVAQRAKVKIGKEDFNYIIASHNGYKNKGIQHTRSYLANNLEVIIYDTIDKDLEVVAHFHFHPDINVKINLLEKKIFIDNITITFEGCIDMKKSTYKFANGFNNRLDAEKVYVSFKNSLKTNIKIES